jgi:hypothetical protein
MKTWIYWLGCLNDENGRVMASFNCHQVLLFAHLAVVPYFDRLISAAGEAACLL